MFIKGSLAQANSGILFSAELARTQAAENARRLRQNTNRQSVQRGGVLYAGNAQEMIHSRKEQELAKAQAAVVRAQTKVDKL